jgi:hypothetical protein
MSLSNYKIGKHGVWVTSSSKISVPDFMKIGQLVEKLK